MHYTTLLNTYFHCPLIRTSNPCLINFSSSANITASSSYNYTEINYFLHFTSTSAFFSFQTNEKLYNENSSGEQPSRGPHATLKLHTSPTLTSPLTSIYTAFRKEATQPPIPILFKQTHHFSWSTLQQTFPF